MESVIEKVSIGNKDIIQAQRDYYRIRNIEEPERMPEIYYRHKKTGKEYLYVLGAFAMPGYDKPGFAVIVALDRHEDPDKGERIIRVLEEYEGTSIKILVKGCLDMKEKYNIDNGFYCDVDETTQQRVVDAVEAIDSEAEFYPMVGPYAQAENSFSQYLLTLIDCQRILDRGDCNKLKNYMENGPRNIKEASALKPEDNPAIAAIAYGVSALTVFKPWHWANESAFIIEEY
jgi:hypothetical protein